MSSKVQRLTERQTEVMAMIEKDRMAAVKYRRTINSLINRGLIFTTGEETDGMIVCGMVKAKVEQIKLEGFTTLTPEQVNAKNIERKTRHAEKLIKAYGRWVEIHKANGARKAMAYGWAREFAQSIGFEVAEWNDHAVLVVCNKAEMWLSHGITTIAPETTVLKPITFDDVKQTNGWMSTDVDNVTCTLPAGTEVKPGFWNCCQSKPAVAVQFTSEETGGHVYYQGCRSCASTVPAERLAKLPETAACVVLTGEQIRALVVSVRIMGYRTAANSDGRMSLARNFRPTVKGFNADYGHQCKTWADVRAVLIAAGVKGVKA